MDKYADRSRSPRSSTGEVNRVAEIQRPLNLATESRRLGRHLASSPYSQKNGSSFRSRGGKVSDALTRRKGE
jgi:hypothetical protein